MTAEDLSTPDRLSLASPDARSYITSMMIDRSKHTRVRHLASRPLGVSQSICLPLLLLLGTAAFAQTEFEGEVSGVWDTDGSPYIQVGGANVPEGESLTIRPGVEIELLPESEFQIDGKLSAIGTEDDTIRFTRPVGEVGGTLRLASTQDTSTFAYCRFDSLADAIWANRDTYFRVGNSFFYENDYAIGSNPRWAEVTNCSFIAVSRLGFVGLGRDRRLGIYRNAVVNFSDNWLQGTTWTSLQCQTVLAERNRSALMEVDGDSLAVRLEFWESQRVTCRDNRGLNIRFRNLNVGLEEAIVAHNESSLPITFSNSGNARIECNNNRCSGITFSNATNAVANNNITNGGFSISGGSRISLTRNFGNMTLDEDDNVVEVNNCTMVRIRRLIDPPTSVIHLIDSDRHQGNRVILRNNLIFGRQNISHAVGEGIAVEGSGYNCIWGVPTAYAEREDLLPDDFVEDPLLRAGFPYDYRLRADSPCIDAGDPESPEDPDGTRADIGCYYFDQQNGEPPALDCRWDYYIGWNETFRYAAKAVDEGEELDIRFEGLPEWLEIEEDEVRRDFVRDSVVVSGVVPDSTENFWFRVIATDDQDREDTLSVRVMVYPYRVLTGVVSGVLDVERSPYIVADTAWIPAGDSLVLLPGTHLYFDNRNDSLAGRAKSMLMVMGTIKAVGEEGDSVWIGALDTNFSNTGIQFGFNPDVYSEFRYCKLNYIRFDYTPRETNIELSYNRLVEAKLQARGYTSRAAIIRNHGTGLINFNGKGLVEENALNDFSIWHGDSIYIRQNVFGRLSAYFGSLNRTDTTFIGVQDNIINGSVNTDVYRSGGDYQIEYRNNRIIGATAVGVELSGQARIEFSNNIVSDCDSIAFKIYPFDQLTHIYNNVANNVGMTIYARYSQNWEERFQPNLAIINNVFYTFDTLLYSYRGRTTGIRYNSLYDFAFLSSDTAFNAHLTQTNTNGDSVDAHFNLYLDPRLVNPDSLDFRLYADSPLINAGNPDSSFNDVDGTINDIGLFGGPFGSEYEYLDPNEVISFSGPPREFRVGNAYPNPFNLTANISVEVPYHGIASFRLFDLQGRKIASHSVQLTAGTHRRSISEFLNLDTSGLRSGLYLLTVEFGGRRIHRKLVLVK